MYSIPEQLSALNKSNIDAIVAFFGITSAGAERLLDYQVKAAKAAFGDAAKNVRTLRSLGVTVRKTIDTVIATRCIQSGFALLYSDGDFDPFVEHLGLRSALPGKY